MLGWARSVCRSVFWDEDCRGLSWPGVRQTVNRGSAWQVIQQVMIEVTGRTMWRAQQQTWSGKKWECQDRGALAEFSGRKQHQSKWGVLQLRRSENTAWRGLTWFVGEGLLSGLHIEQMSAADVFKSFLSLPFTTVGSLTTMSLWLPTLQCCDISAFCWYYNAGPVHWYQSHHPAATDMKIICICLLDCLCRFVSVCKVTWVIRETAYSW